MASKWFKVSTGGGGAPDTPEDERWLMKAWAMLDNPFFPNAARRCAALGVVIPNSFASAD